MVCGECGAQRWYATSAEPDDGGGMVRRLVCVGCGNEVFMQRVTHAPGSA